MEDKGSPQGKGFLTPEEAQGWLKEEIRDSAKALELRVKEATTFVAEYAAGRLTPEEANDHLVRYDQRWGEALYGASAFPGCSDEEILKAIDKARDETLHTRKLSHSENLAKGTRQQRDI